MGDTQAADKPKRATQATPFTEFLYNKHDGTVMGRTGSSWGKFNRFERYFNLLLQNRMWPFIGSCMCQLSLCVYVYLWVIVSNIA